ncbi:MAG: hypothetical protein HYU78_15190 [Rhodocyclales bacterium]|nr:hypothetical protein [Rhodocyclales bacterium]
MPGHSAAPIDDAENGGTFGRVGVIRSLTWRGAVLFLAGIGLWLWSHPYWGIWHDARVYTLMAVRWLDPTSFSRDPWFMFGSQDSFTLFSPIYGTAISAFGINAAAKWGTLLAGLSYVAASWLFSRVLPLGRWRDLVFLLLVSVQLVYCVNDFGPVETLRVSESFITSRQIAVSLAMVAFAAFVSRRQGMAAVLFAAAMVFHPLIAMWVGLAAIGTLFRFCSLLVLAAVGAATLVGLSVAGVGIFRPLAGEWGALVRETARVVFVQPEGFHRLDFALACYAVLLAGSRWGQVGLQPWYRVVLVVSATAYAVNWICSAFFPAAIIMQAQLWRGNWFALVIAVIAGVDLALRFGSADRLVRHTGLAATSLLFLSPWAGAWAVLLAACSPRRFLIALQTFLSVEGEVAIRVFRFGSWILLALAGIDAVLQIEAVGSNLWRVGDASNDLADFGRSLLFTGGYGLCALAVWWAASRSRLAWPAMVVALVLVATGLWQWGARVPIGRQFDETYWSGNAVGTQLFAEHVRPGDVVYWQRHPERVWFGLRTASYVSNTQAVGIVFSEKMALEVAKRLGRVALAGTSEPVLFGSAANREEAVKLRNSEDGQPIVKLNDLHSYEAGSLTLDGLRFICGDRELDFVIHDKLFPDYVLASWSETVGPGLRRWNLYDCRSFR